MGLDVTLYKIVNIHKDCTSSRDVTEEPETYYLKRNQKLCDPKLESGFEIAKDQEMPGFDETFTYMKRSCDCSPEYRGNLLSHQILQPGYWSAFDNLSTLSTVYEVKQVDTVWFGSYGLHARAVDVIGNFSGISDCDGFYTGNRIELVKHKLLSFRYIWSSRTNKKNDCDNRWKSSVEEYFYLLKRVPQNQTDQFIVTHG